MRAQCDDLGVIGHTAPRPPGFHTTMAVDDAGLQLGLLKLEFDAPRPGKDKLPEERKSARWMAAAPKRPGGSKYATGQRAGKRTSSKCSPSSGVSAIILVRAKHSRKLSKTEKLFDSVRAAPVQGHRKLTVSRLSQRPKVSKRKRRTGARNASPTWRFVPSLCRRRRAEPRRFPFRSFSEPKPPEGAKPVVLAYHGRRFVRRRRHAGRGLVRPEMAQTGIAR